MQSKMAIGIIMVGDEASIAVRLWIKKDPINSVTVK